MPDAVRDYSETLFLPKTDFPMRAGLPQREPEILAHWQRLGLYRKLREAAVGRPRFILHDGPPYANGNIHIGHALNKILKDVVTRSQQMLGYDSNYVPGWDCHGLPIEWKIEEEYRAKGKNKDAVPIIEFRRECRAFAQHWIEVQREEFKRLGVIGDWDHPYTTMAYAAEAQIARELMKFAANGTLYRGSKPVMWSVVEKTALAEAEVEYEDYVSDTVWVKFPVRRALKSYAGVRPRPLDRDDVWIVIWTTTPWTLPGNRAVSFSPRIAYSVYRVTEAPEGNWAKVGDRLVLADTLADEVMRQARVTAFERLTAVPQSELVKTVCVHPLRDFDDRYAFPVPLLPGDHVTDDVGTGFVHTAPGHGREDFEVWTANARALQASGINTAIPYTVDENGAFTAQAPGFAGKRVLTDKGTKGDANDAVIKALVDAGMLIARGRLKHQYPHSWRSKKPVIFRNTPQWFIAMDKPFVLGGAAATGDAAPVGRATGSGHARADRSEGVTGRAAGFPPPSQVGPARLAHDNSQPGQARVAWGRDREGGATRSSLSMDTPHPNPPPQGGREQAAASGEVHAAASGAGVQTDTLRARALTAIAETRWVPAAGENRITGMIESRPDWVISRQRAWGVPIAVFVRETGDGAVEILKDQRVNARIADAFEAEGADAWYAPGARERFLGERANEGWQKVDDILDVWFDSGSTYAFTLEVRDDLKTHRKHDGGPDTVMYLEGSDQHRGWFHSSLLESCGTRGVAPYDVVLTHGFVLDENGRPMSKSVGNVVAPQSVIKDSGADILRLWVCAADYADDLRLGPEILKTTVDTYRKLRNTVRWMLGNLVHYQADEQVSFADMPELERLMLHRLAELDALVRQDYADFDYKRIFAALSHFMTGDLSAFYFDIRKDALYCDPASSVTRRAALTVLDQLFRCTVIWLAPMLCFTAEEAWLSRFGAEAGSVHLQMFPELPGDWRDDALAEKWRKLRTVRRVITGALEIERAKKRIGSSLEADPFVYVADPGLFAALVDIDLAEVCITSSATLLEGEGPAEAFRIPEVPGVAVDVRLAQGTKCARSWKISPAVGTDPAYPDVTPRDAQALREWDAIRKAAE